MTETEHWFTARAGATLARVDLQRMDRATKQG
jgi:hypothetical protein